MKCKVINNSKFELESKINDWLDSGNYEITNIVQSQNETYITLTIFYLDLKELRKKKLEKIEKS